MDIQETSRENGSAANLKAGMVAAGDKGEGDDANNSLQSEVLSGDPFEDS